MWHSRHDGLRLYYESHGHGSDTILFIHGYTGDSTDWNAQVPEFAPAHRVVVLDNTGHGRSEGVYDESAYTVPAMVEDCETLLGSLSIPNYHVVGHSIGGAVAQEMALRRPDRVLSLTLVDTSYWFGDHHERGEAPYVPVELASEDAARLERMSKHALQAGWHGLLAWSGSGERLNTIRMPTLVIHGSRDARPIIEGSQVLARTIPGATLLVFEGAGHSPHRECPLAFNEALREFIASV